MINSAQPAPIRRALLSVSDKTGIVDFARALGEFGVEILSTGGTARLLAENGIAVSDVSAYTGFPEMLDGRLKTLHPKIHGGLLGRRGVDDEVLAGQGIPFIDLVAVNLYPFETAIAKPDCTLATAIENIDIGGPTLLRAAAKNYTAVTAVVDPADYDRILADMRAHQGAVSAAVRFDLAVSAFAHTARYDGAVANYLSAIEPDAGKADFPRFFSLQLHRVQAMRYGENPHQKAAFYADTALSPASIASAQQLQGKELSFNNVADADAALECVKAFKEPACVIVKHANPCGVAIADDIESAYARAFQTDPTSAFGGIIAFNRPLDAATARAVLDNQFVEALIAPAVTDEARPILNTKPNVRVLACGTWDDTDMANLDYKRVTGGLLVQDRDFDPLTTADLHIVTRRSPSESEWRDLLFAWKIVQFVKSNAIVYCRDGMTIGIGAGQMSRVFSARIAALKAADAGLELTGAVMASDAFFPFRDGIDTAAAAGIRAVIQPGGSLRDTEVIAAADEYDLAMAFTGKRHFRH